MRSSTFLVAVVAAVLFASSAYGIVCVAPAATKRYYTLPNAAYQCPAVMACRQALCTCNGLAETCTETFFSTTQCTAGFQCLRNYTTCLNDAAPNATGSGGICNTWGTSIVNLRNSFAAGTNTNWFGQDIYKACAYQACLFINNVNCTDASSYMCQRPPNAPTATNAPPLSSIPTVAPDVVKAEVKVAAAFQGDFSGLFAPGKEEALESFCNTTSLALATRLGIPAGAYKSACRQGSLIVDLTVETAADDTTVQDVIVNNAANLNEDTDTTWIDDLQAAAVAACSDCAVTVLAPIVATAVVIEETPEPAPNTDVEQTCGSGCVAGVIVGVAVLVIVVISVVKIVVKKVSKGSEKTPASHEPTSGV